MMGLPLETNAAQQTVAWLVEMFDQAVANWDTLSTAIAAGLAVYLAFVLYERFQSSDDPSFRMQSETAAGTVNVLVSGAAVTGAILGLIAFLTWPLAIEDPFIGSVLVAVFGTHYYLEKQEAR
jgi:hypothetical protein